MKSNPSFLEVKEVSKTIDDKIVLENISFDIHAGQVLGILGPNGSGKSTLINIIISLIQPDKGTVRLFETSFELGIKKIGVVSETHHFYPYFSGEKNLKIVSLIKESDVKKNEQLLKITGLANDKSKLFKNYSLGMKQRLALASALVGEPCLLILDEPTNGLDASGIIDLREFIKSYTTLGKSVLITSHIISFLEEVCTDIIFLSKGRIKSKENVPDLKNRSISIESVYLKAIEH